MTDSHAHRQAIILLGGKGTRISQMYPDRPKALVPVAGKPILVWQIEWLKRNGITHIHLAAGHLADVLQQWLSNNPQPGLTITCSIETQPLGTGGAIKFVEDYIITDPFYVLNGDSLAPNLSFQSLEKSFEKFPTIGKIDREHFQPLEKSTEKVPTIGKSTQKVSNHWKNDQKNFQSLETAEKPPRCTIAVSHIDQTGRYGTVEFDPASTVTAFLEKADRTEGWINTGVYLMNKAILNLIEPGINLSIETQIFPDLVKRQLVSAFTCPSPLLDMGTPDGLATMERFLSDNK